MTVKEIAKLAGTSRGTVDRVLNGRGNVSPELERRVRDIAQSAGYRPNQLARALINSRKRIKIGVVISSLGNPFFDEVLSGIENRANKLSSYGVELSLRKTRGYAVQNQLDAIKELVDSGIDGLAIVPINVPEVKELLSQLTIPIVTFNNDIDIKKLAFVGCDYYNSGALSGDLAKLILSGGGTAAAVVGSFNIAGHRSRIEGFTQSFSERPDIKVAATLENDDDDRRSYDLVKELIETKKPNLIYFGAGGISGGIRAVLESGEDIKVLAVDNTETVRRYLMDGSIAATVTQQPFYQGDNAIRVLYEYLADGKRPEEETIYTENQIMLRSSVL